MPDAEEVDLPGDGASPAETASSCDVVDLPGDARCLKCGYLLQKLTEQRCPECGQPFDPAIYRERIEPLWPTLVGLIMMAMGISVLVESIGVGIVRGVVYGVEDGQKVWLSTSAVFSTILGVYLSVAVLVAGAWSLPAVHISWVRRRPVIRYDRKANRQDKRKAHRVLVAICVVMATMSVLLSVDPLYLRVLIAAVWLSWAGYLLTDLRRQSEVGELTESSHRGAILKPYYSFWWDVKLPVLLTLLTTLIVAPRLGQAAPVVNRPLGSMGCVAPSVLSIGLTLAILLYVMRNMHRLCLAALCLLTGQAAILLVHSADYVPPGAPNLPPLLAGVLQSPHIMILPACLVIIGCHPKVKHRIAQNEAKLDRE